MAKTQPFDEHALEYDAWYDQNVPAFRSELEALLALMPASSVSVEVGAGTGRFAAALGIKWGLEPSTAMAKVAQKRGVEPIQGVAESLPFADATLDLVLMVTTLCFLDDVPTALSEAFRVLVSGGHVLIGFLDRDSRMGRVYELYKASSKFYGLARFLKAEEVLAHLRDAGFSEPICVQTLFEQPSAMTRSTSPREGHGDGLFVVVRARKPPLTSAAQWSP